MHELILFYHKIPEKNHRLVDRFERKKRFAFLSELSSSDYCVLKQLHATGLFNSPRKHWKTSGSLIFQGGKERDQRYEIKTSLKIIKYLRT